MKFFRIFLLLFCICSPAFSQDSFNDKFNDANLLMDEKLYAVALPVWLEILQTDTDNANWNYKVGLCYFNSSTERSKSLYYFEKAKQKITKNYNPFSSDEEHAPLDAYFYLARAYHVNNEIDKAVEYFTKFKELAGKKHFLLADVTRNLEMCQNAKELMAKPVTVKITNIGNLINSTAPEYGALISLDERALYFTSRRLWLDSSNAQYKDRADGIYFEDIYVSYKGINGEWESPEMLNFNRIDDHEATVSLSADGQTIFLYLDDGGDGNLYQSFLFGETWTAPVPLTQQINSKSLETHMTTTIDGRTMYFVSNRKGGIGGKDIYECAKLPNGQWSEPKNLGPTINTTYDEDGTYIHPDGKTLYFSSQGHKSIGGYDIFMTTKNDDGTWTAPYNLGYPINTTDDDVFFILSPDGKRAYYSSARTDGFGDKDIYIVEQPEAMEKSLTLIKGYIHVPEGQELPEDVTIIITDNETGQFVTEVKPLKRNGSFVFVIPPGKNYNISYTSNGVEFYNENVYVPIGSHYKEVDKEILLNPLKLGTPDAVAINIKGETDVQMERKWLLHFFNSLTGIPDSTTIQYLDESGNVIYEELLGKSGIFAYHELEKGKPFLFTLKAKDGPLCKEGEIVLLGHEDSSYKFSPDENCIFKLSAPKKSVFRFTKLGYKIPEGLTLQYLDEKENVLFEDMLSQNGEFAFRQLPSDSSYIIKIKSSDPSLCDGTEILIPGKNGETIRLTPDAKCIFRLREQKPTFSFASLENDASKGLTIQYLSDKGKIMYEEKTNTKGEFAFHKLPSEKEYMLKLKNADQTLCEQGEITMPGPNGMSYILVADENCVFKLVDKKSKFVYNNLTKEIAQGLTIQIIDENGNIVVEEKMNERGEFSYYKLPPDKKYTIKLLPYNAEKFRETEIIIPSYGKKFHKFTPDETGVFRMKEISDEKIVAEKEKTAVNAEKTINFEYDKSNIPFQYQKELDYAAKALKENSSLKIDIFGHTDSKGTDEYNHALSQRRAESAAQYLSSKGVSRSRMTIKGFGESQPISPNIHPDGTDNPEGRKQNRRIEIKVR